MSFRGLSIQLHITVSLYLPAIGGYRLSTLRRYDTVVTIAFSNVRQVGGTTVTPFRTNLCVAAVISLGVFACTDTSNRGESKPDSTSTTTQADGSSMDTHATTDGSQSTDIDHGDDAEEFDTSRSPADTTAGDEDTGTSSKLDCELAWQSGFEKGFPGNWLDYDKGSWSEDGSMPQGRVSAWTIVDKSSGEPVHDGDHSYKGWITGPASKSHRAYPVVHLDVETPLVNTFMVYLKADYSKMKPAEWIHFGTWGNTGRWALHTMSVRNEKLEFAHTDPFSGEYIGPMPQPTFPVGKWVRFTVYLHYKGKTGFVKVWQDGTPMLRANVSALQQNPGTALQRAHWGMYAHKDVAQGTQYNDAIRIWKLSEPPDNLDDEPRCF